MRCLNGYAVKRMCRMAGMPCTVSVDSLCMRTHHAAERLSGHAIQWAYAMQWLSGHLPCPPLSISTTNSSLQGTLPAPPTTCSLHGT